MKAVPIKPALNAGFLLLKSALLVLTVPGSVWAQDYVDVEAERRAAEQVHAEQVEHERVLSLIHI